MGNLQGRLVTTLITIDRDTGLDHHVLVLLLSFLETHSCKICQHRAACQLLQLLQPKSAGQQTACYCCDMNQKRRRHTGAASQRSKLVNSRDLSQQKMSWSRALRCCTSAEQGKMHAADGMVPMASTANGRSSPASTTASASDDRKESTIALPID